ncbi:MAG: lytic murein transglycosylase [Gammaproteobacteria bacterium]|nr:lytic murein transglycosylase [Gammaproteobacteria bacterium]
MEFAKRNLIASFALSLLLFAFATPTLAATNQNTSWQAWVKNLRTEAVTEGINPQLFDRIFHNMTPSAKHIRLDRNQPETRLTYYKYRNTRANNYRIKLGQKLYRKHKVLLDKIGQDFGVSPCYIVTLWGLESSYGRYMGDFKVTRSLATLAYDSRRGPFFRKELLLALHMINDGHVVHETWVGEWAGASGQSQFLPSSWYKYAVDYDNDGFKDIWKNYPDIFASIANYLRENGWETGQPVLVKVSLPHNFNHNLLGLKHEKPVYDWQNLGVKINNNYPIPNPHLMASVIEPYGGPVFMVFNNYKVLLRWNYSLFYAATINYTAANICN